MNQQHSSPNHDLSIEQQLKQRNILLDRIAQEMRAANASDADVLTVISGSSRHTDPPIPALTQLDLDLANELSALVTGSPGPTHFLPLSDEDIARYSSIPTPPPIPDPQHGTTTGRLYSEYPASPLQWLLPDRIPFGHLTLLEGPSGSGTTLLALHFAALISNHNPRPDGTVLPCGNVILISPYHSPTTITHPRLYLASAHPSHVLNLSCVADIDPRTNARRSRPFSLPQDLHLLEDAITSNHARLVILDPISAILPSSAPRTVLPHLAQIAQRTHCAILLIRPITAPPANRPLPTRSTCSPEFFAAFASALLALPNPEDPDQCLLISTKHSFTHAPDTLLYHITTPAQEGIQPTIAWLDEHEPHPDVSSDPSQPISELRTLITGIIKSDTKALDAPAIIKHITFYTQYKYDAVRKALQRMLKSGELVSPARSLYTTPGHPSLAQFPANIPVPNVPTNQPIIPVTTNQPTTVPVPSVTTNQPIIPVTPVITNQPTTVPVPSVTTNQPIISTNSIAIVPVPNVPTNQPIIPVTPVITNQPTTVPVPSVTNQPLDQEHTHP